METVTLNQTTFIPAAPEKVYEGFVDGKVHALMTGAGASADPVVGGEFSAWDGYIFGTFLELVPHSRIVQAWQTSEWPEGYPPSKFAITLTPKDDGTEITMVHSDVPKEQADDYAQGWEDYYWEPMQSYFGQQQ